MAVLLFCAGDNRFAIDCSAILRVVPSVILKDIPHHAHFVAGLMTLGGRPIPVIDFCQIIEKRAAHPFLSSRIIILKDTSCGADRYVGILGEKVDEIVDLHPKEFDQPEFYLLDLPFISKGFSDSKGVIHLINLKEFFSFLAAEVFHGAGNDRYDT